MAQVGDHVVPGLALDLGHPLEIDLVGLALERLELVGGDPETELALAAGEGDPKPAPGTETVGGGKDPRHLARGIALVERILGRVVVALGVHRDLLGRTEEDCNRQVC